MRCPHDNTDLLMSERQGIEIDYCPTCCGIWLDRGELDKLIERAAAASGSAVNMAQRPNPDHGGRDWNDPGTDDDDDQPRSRRRSFLDDVFDMFH